MKAKNKVKNLKKEARKLKATYEKVASANPYATSTDFNLRELEIDAIQKYLKNGIRLLDVGCGNGYSIYRHAQRFRLQAVGIDYAENMIANARQMKLKNLKGAADFRVSSVTAIPFPDSYFDVVTSSRCLMALLDWKLQKRALQEIHRVLKPKGLLILQEGTLQGLERLNAMRGRFGLKPIPAQDSKGWLTLKFDENKLLKFARSLYKLVAIKRFGMYYFISRVVHPLLVAPEKPRFDAKINAVARRIASQIPDYEGLGHLVSFVFKKK